MSLSSPVITGQVVTTSRPNAPDPTGTPGSAEPAVALLAHGVLEELYRRRGAIAFTMTMSLCLLAAAVGLRVWGVDGTAGAALENPGFSVSGASSDPADGGPSGTWQRWGDLGSQKRSQSPTAVPSGTSTTTFSTSGVTPGSPVAPTTTTTQPASS